MARSGGLIAVFGDFVAIIGEIFILAGGAGRWAIILWGLKTFQIFPNFLNVVPQFVIYHVY